MNDSIMTGIIILILAGICLTAGCSQYADPELKITNTITRVAEDPVSGNITYDVTVTVSNTGENNAHKVTLLTILSTPKDLPEYRFISRTFEIGDVLKGTNETITGQMILPMTKSNYDLIISGTREPEIDTTVSSVTSNVMG